MNNNEAVSCYQCLVEEYATAKRLVKDISSITADVSRCLTTEPYRLTISGMGMDIPLNPGFAGKQLVCSPEQWPTAETMAEAVSRLYKAEKALRQAFEKLSPEEKLTVGMPPGAR
jgi:hypothetical protein